ncbi:hypothetical protein [Chitinophaga vietnamensis]|uniref:hypothetical protein n=1 Tax=Chitinophaga vietnamensis TaxID=2593957 RepID=UPI001177BB86|nr:hypothetical protein [Chitinophaga vietnamensis]
MSYLHVLNGDAIVALFKQSGLPGDYIVCREMLCEGKVKHTKDPSVFFESRAKHLEFQYGIDKQTYYSNVVQELEKLNSSGSWTEIILWFEYDLFCQINQLFMLHYIRQQLKPLPNISLVDLPHQRDANTLKSIFETRVILDSDDLQMATDAWDAYCLDTPLALETMAMMPGGKLPHLHAAIHAHLQRFPNTTNGLSAVELYLLQKLSLADYRWYDLYVLFWDEMKIYGFGDFQLDIYTLRMRRAGVIEQIDQMLKITALGREVLDNEENYIDYVSLEHRWLGGVRLQNSQWRWNTALKRIVSI